MAFIPTADLIAKPNLNYVWDPGSMTWVKETQPGGSGGGGTSSSFSAPFPATGTAVGFLDTGGNMSPGLLDASGFLKVNVAAGGAGGGAMTVADGADVAEGATTDAAVTSDANGTISAKLRGLVKWAFERMPASLGQKAMAASLPVVVASDQSAIPITRSTVSTSHTFTSNNEAFDIDVTQLGSLAIYQATAVGGFDGKVFMQGSTDGATFFGVFAIREDDGQPIDFINQNSTGFVVRINVSGLKTFRLLNTNWTVGSSQFLVSGSSQTIENPGVNIYDKATQNHLAIDGGGRIKFNEDQISGVAVDVNTGNASNGTQRVVLATDQPAVPVSGSVGISGTVDVSDRDARLLGRTKILDSSGAVIDPALKSQLPAALVGGRLDENVGAWLGSTAPTVGSKTSVNSVPVVIASDQSAVPIQHTETSGSGVLQNSGDAITVPCANANTVLFECTSRTATVNFTASFQGSIDGGVTYGFIGAAFLSTTDSPTGTTRDVWTGTLPTSFFLNVVGDIYSVPCAGFTHVRLALGTNITAGNIAFAWTTSTAVSRTPFSQTVNQGTGSSTSAWQTKIVSGSGSGLAAFVSAPSGTVDSNSALAVGLVSHIPLPAGTNNIGTVTVVDQPTAIALDGRTVSFGVNWEERRLLEAQLIQAQLSSLETMLVADSENSQRMGFELR